MNIPPEFMVFAQAFHQDTISLYKNEQEMVRAALEHLNERETEIVRAYIHKLDAMALTKVELEMIWQKTSAEISFPDDNIVKFFRYLKTAV